MTAGKQMLSIYKISKISLPQYTHIPLSKMTNIDAHISNKDINKCYVQEGLY